MMRLLWITPGFVAVQSAPSGDSSRRASASPAPPSTRDTQKGLHPFNGRRRPSIAQFSRTPEMPQHGYQPPVSPTENSYSMGGLGTKGIPTIQFPLSPPATPTKVNGSGIAHGSEMTPSSAGSGRSPTAANFLDRRGFTTAIRMNSVVFDESPMAHLSVINEGSYDMAQIPSDPDRRSSKAYELNQPNSAEKLYRAGNYHLRKVKSISPFKLALVTVLTLTTIYCLLLVVRVAVDSIAMQPSTRSFTGDFRRASQRAADLTHLTNGMLKGGNALMVGQESTADHRSHKAWGRESRSKNEPIRSVRPAIVDDGDDDYFDDRLPPESEVSDDERERRIRESISRAAQRVRKENFLLQASDSKAASSQGDAADDKESTPKKRKKGPARKFGSKSDLSRGSPREGRRPVNQASQLEKQHAATAVDPEEGAEIDETVPVTMEDKATVEEAPARSRGSADTARQVATSDASDDELVEDSEDSDEEEKPVPPPPRPASKKTKAQPASPRAPAPARKAAVLTNDNKLRTTRRPIRKGAAAGAQSGPAPLDSSSAMEEEPDEPAAQRLAKAGAQLMAAREQLAAQVAADARSGSARQHPLDAAVVPMQTIKTTRKEKVGGAARASADKSHVVDEPVQPKKDGGKQEQQRPMAMRAKKKGSPARQRHGPNA